MITFALGWLAGWAAVAAMLWYRRTFATLRSVTWLEDGSGLATWGRRRLFIEPQGVSLNPSYPRRSYVPITARWHDSGCVCPKRVHLAVMAARERDRFNERLLAA